MLEGSRVSSCSQKRYANMRFCRDETSFDPPTTWIARGHFVPPALQCKWLIRETGQVHCRAVSWTFPHRGHLYGRLAPFDRDAQSSTHRDSRKEMRRMLFFVLLAGYAAGICALVTAKVIKARNGRFRSDGTVYRLPQQSPALQTLGALILWVGWCECHC